MDACRSKVRTLASTYDSSGATASSYGSVVGCLDLEPVRADLLAIQLRPRVDAAKNRVDPKNCIVT